MDTPFNDQANASRGLFSVSFDCGRGLWKSTVEQRVLDACDATACPDQYLLRRASASYRRGRVPGDSGWPISAKSATQFQQTAPLASFHFGAFLPSLKGPSNEYDCSISARSARMACTNHAYSHSLLTCIRASPLKDPSTNIRRLPGLSLLVQ